MRAGIYVRQSKDALQTGLAVARQRQDCERLCAERGWTVVRTITENDTSATNGKRPGYSELLQLADSQALDIIVCWHLDRLTRKLTELEDVITRCEKTGVRVATVSGDLDLSTDAGRLVGRILASVARGEVERKSARQKRAALQAAEAGELPHRRSFGFHADGAHHETEAPVLVELYSKVLAGMSLTAATKWLDKQGYRSTTGKLWTHSGVKRLLLNPRNAGLRKLRGVVIGRGKWAPIVPEEIWQAAVEKLTDPARRTNGDVGTGRKWLGSHLFLCWICGSPCRVNYDRTKRRVYQCKAHAHLARGADDIENVVLLTIAARLRRPDLEGLLAAEAPDVGPLREQARVLRARLDTITGDYAEGLLTAHQLHVATTKVGTTLDAVEKQLAAAGRSTGLGWLATALDPGQTFLEADLNVKRAVIDALAVVTILAGRPGRVPFDPATVKIEWKTS